MNILVLYRPGNLPQSAMNWVKHVSEPSLIFIRLTCRDVTLPWANLMPDWVDLGQVTRQNNNPTHSHVYQGVDTLYIVVCTPSTTEWVRSRVIFTISYSV